MAGQPWAFAPGSLYFDQSRESSAAIGVQATAPHRPCTRLAGRPFDAHEVTQLGHSPSDPRSQAPCAAHRAHLMARGRVGDLAARSGSLWRAIFRGRRWSLRRLSSYGTAGRGQALRMLCRACDPARTASRNDVETGLAMGDNDIDAVLQGGHDSTARAARHRFLGDGRQGVATVDCRATSGRLSRERVSRPVRSDSGSLAALDLRTGVLHFSTTSGKLRGVGSAAPVPRAPHMHSTGRPRSWRSVEWSNSVSSLAVLCRCDAIRHDGMRGQARCCGGDLSPRRSLRYASGGRAPVRAAALRHAGSGGDSAH